MSQKSKEETILGSTLEELEAAAKKVKKDKKRNCAIWSGDELSTTDSGVTQVEE